MSETANPGGKSPPPPHVPIDLVFDFDVYNAAARDEDFHLALKRLHESDVPEVFCYSAVNATEQLPELEDMRREYAEKTRNRLQYHAAFSPLADKLAAVLRQVIHGVRANKSALGGDSLEIYRVLRARLKNSRNPGMRAHVDGLQRDLAKKSATKAEREQQRALKLEKAVEDEIARRAAKGMLTIHEQKEVKAAA